ncbi:MAG TPA: hypothetical protein VHE55_08820 [Fimbriimonadaceae bacterium]|nr:hypothetical protein [Fimbriimonadaceae bacterium]
MTKNRVLGIIGMASLGAMALGGNGDWRSNGTLSFFFDSTQPSGWVTGQDLFSQGVQPAKDQGAWSETKTGGNQYTFTLHQLWSLDQLSAFGTTTKATQIGQAWGSNGASRWAHFHVRWIQKADYQVYDPITHQVIWIRFHKPTTDIIVHVKHELQFKGKLALSHYARDTGQSSTNCWAWQEMFGEGWFQLDQTYFNGAPRWNVNHLFLGGDPSNVTKLTGNKTFGPTTKGWSVDQFLDSNNHWQSYSEYVIHAADVTLVGTSNGRDVYEADLPSQVVSLFLYQAVHLEHAKGHFDIDTTGAGRVTLTFP